MSSFLADYKYEARHREPESVVVMVAGTFAVVGAFTILTLLGVGAWYGLANEGLPTAFWWIGALAVVSFLGGYVAAWRANTRRDREENTDE